MNKDSKNRSNSERNKQEVGTVSRERTPIVYHDEQIPVETRYKTDDVSFDYAPRWTGVSTVNSKYINSNTPVSIKGDGDGKVYQQYGEIEQSGKIWASSLEQVITMVGVVPRVVIQDEVNTQWFQDMWRVFDNKAWFKDTGRKINIDWGAAWSKLNGSIAIHNILAEEIRLSDQKFYGTSDEENLDLTNGNCQSVAEAHIGYFTDVLTDIRNKHKDKIPKDEGIAVALLAICEFAHKLSKKSEPLKARFVTAAYSSVRNAYRDAVDRKDVIMKKSLQKVQDMRTLNDFIKNFRDNLFTTPTVEDILNGTEFGKRRVESTFRIFDFNISSFRDMNQEEMLYTVMDEHLTDRQSEIVERSYGIGGRIKSDLTDMAEDMNINEKTIRRDKVVALEIIKEHLAFKYENRN